MKTLVTALVIGLALPSTSAAQGGGASSTGTIQGRVADAQGAVLPGVTVTATSPSVIGAQTTVTSETGNYRFPAVPPGDYELTFELAGFNTLKREGIAITLGFTANVNVELALATLQETVTVSGASPVIDTTRDARAAELQAGAAAVDSERPRHVGAARGDARRCRWAASTSAATAPARRPATPPTA